MTVLTASTATPEHLYSVEYDIDSSDVLCAGKIVLTKDMQLILFADGKTETREEYRCDFNEVKELQINSHIGCASLEAELKNGDRIRICRFTQSCLSQISEFIKAANYYIETGEYTEINIERTVCPKCGKHFIVNTQICPNCSNKASIVGKFLSLGKKYMPAFALSGLLVLFCNVINLIIPHINRILVDDYLFPASEGLEPWGDKNPVLMILVLILMMLACYVLIRVINIVAARMRNATSAKFINSVRIKLYDKIQVLSMSSISRRTTGDLIKRVTEDTSVITEFIKSETVWMIEIGVIFIGVSGYFIATRPLLALFVFLPVPLVLFAASRFWNFIHRRYEKQWRLSSTANGILHDIIRGIRVVKVFGTEKSEIEKCLPVGCVLTIAAAGSEMSDSSVITKDDGGIKRGYSNRYESSLAKRCLWC